ncbi:MAG TPA: DUF4142 domain-containing protein [Lacipirellulaceae bacterium]|jgi:putative membrane protein|nr:DUF4142 domain-containing protein [Lacipirellulaceae bacterium]
MHHRFRVSSLLVLAVGFWIGANSVSAQQKENSSPADVKPAQAGSPAAHPTESRDRNGSQGNVTNENRSAFATEERSTNATSDRREDNFDREVAACLLDKNKAEVELGKIAAERANDKDVKEFAEKMIKDHNQVVEKLERIAGSNEPNDRRSKVEHRIGERCLANLKKELHNKSGQDFDACYMGSQIAGHMEMVATLEVLSDETSGELRDVIKDAQPTVEKHLSNAKDIMKQLDKASNRNQASRNRSETSR